MDSSSNIRQSPSKAIAAARSIEDWGLLSKEALVLEYNACNLEPTGTILTLSERLYEHYHQALDPSSGSTGVISPIKSVPSSEEEDDDNDGSRHDKFSEPERVSDDNLAKSPSRQKRAREEENNDSQTTDPYGDRPTEKEDLASTALQISQANSELIKDILKRIGDMHTGQELYRAEVRALRSAL